MIPRWTARPIAGLDLETSGVNPRGDFIVSYALALKRPGERVKVMRSLVHPPGDAEIPKEATVIHGVTTERARAEGVMGTTAVATLVKKLMEWARDDIPLVVTNASFDLTMVDRWATEFGFQSLRDPAWDGAVLDPYVLDKHLDKWRKGSRTLSALCAHYKVPMVGDAHDPGTDVTAAIHLVLAIAEKYHWIGVKSPGQLHALQVRGALTQRADLSRHFESKGARAIPQDEWKWPLWDPVAEPTQWDPDELLVRSSEAAVKAWKGNELSFNCHTFGVEGATDEERRAALLPVLIERRRAGDPTALNLF